MKKKYYISISLLFLIVNSIQSEYTYPHIFHRKRKTVSQALSINNLSYLILAYLILSYLILSYLIFLYPLLSNLKLYYLN